MVTCFQPSEPKQDVTSLFFAYDSLVQAIYMNIPVLVYWRAQAFSFVLLVNRLNRHLKYQIFFRGRHRFSEGQIPCHLPFAFSSYDSASRISMSLTLAVALVYDNGTDYGIPLFCSDVLCPSLCLADQFAWPRRRVKWQYPSLQWCDQKSKVVAQEKAMSPHSKENHLCEFPAAVIYCGKRTVFVCCCSYASWYC